MEYLHSTLRYLILFFLISSIYISFVKWRGKKPFTNGDKITYLMTLIFCHLQLVVGIILFLMKNYVKAFSNMDRVMTVPILRFFTIEHTLLMLLGITFVTIGYATAKRAKEDVAKHKKTFIFYLIGFILILAGIPWPFRGFGNDWF